MLLVAGPVPGFLPFIQILCWIVLPLLAFIVLVTVLVHYRKRRRKAIKDSHTGNEEDKFMQATPGQVGYTNGDGEYILFDHSDLIREYKSRLTYSHARITALQRDLSTMGTKYAALASYIQTNFITTKKKTMENVQDKIPGNIQAEINKLASDHEAEKKELLAKVDQLERSYQRLEQENRVLQERISMETTNDDERAAILNRWKEENDSLRNKVTDQEYLEDLVQEKKAQINFLQNQLEQRIKDLYKSEHQRLQTVAEMKQLKEGLKADNEAVNNTIESLKNELLLKEERADKMQMVFCANEEQLTEKQRVLTEKINHITYLENALREAKEQNEQINASAADSRDLVNTLQQQLSDEQSKVEFTVQKLFANKQLMRRLYKELSVFMNDDNEGSPVIALRPEYSHRENEETAV